MPDWRSTMTQTFEYYVVDPDTWKDKTKLDCIKTSNISRDSDAETRGSATFDVTDVLGECYVRVYLITIQNGLRESHPLGTFLVQSPSSNFDGKTRSISIDAYTPLLELKEKLPPIGYYLPKKSPDHPENGNIMDEAYRIVRENVRTPVVKVTCDKTLDNDFVANVDDTWMSFTDDLIYKAKYEFDLDELGRILFAPIRDIESTKPIWTYDDSNSSILYPEISMDHDMYGIPNVVEVVYSKANGEPIRVERVNDDPNSPVSIPRRGRRIVYRDTNPSLYGEPDEEQLGLYADDLLKRLSTVEYTVSYTHGYCPVRVGDCVRIDYKKSGYSDVKAKVIRQTINCKPGCPVAETAVFTAKLWR